jgi:hypothetical protein
MLTHPLLSSRAVVEEPGQLLTNSEYLIAQHQDQQGQLVV